jgi:hypothetical protein
VCERALYRKHDLLASFRAMGEQGIEPTTQIGLVCSLLFLCSHSLGCVFASLSLSHSFNPNHLRTVLGSGGGGGNFSILYYTTFYWPGGNQTSSITQPCWHYILVLKKTFYSANKSVLWTLQERGAQLKNSGERSSVARHTLGLSSLANSLLEWVLVRRRDILIMGPSCVRWWRRHFLPDGWPSIGCEFFA